jgi:hypothetical protein
VVLAYSISRVVYIIIMEAYALRVKVLISPYIIILASKLNIFIKQYLDLLIRPYYHYYNGIVLSRGLEGLNAFKLYRVLFKLNRHL